RRRPSARWRGRSALDRRRRAIVLPELRESMGRWPAARLGWRQPVSCLRGFDHFFRSKAPRADANPLVASVDDRPNRLQIRLEPARAHGFRVAVLPAHDGTLSAHLTPPLHKEVFCAPPEEPFLVMPPGRLAAQPRAGA